MGRHDVLAVDYLERAAACEALGHSARDPALRTLFVDLAVQWRELARTVRDLSKGSEASFACSPLSA